MGDNPIVFLTDVQAAMHNAEMLALISSSASCLAFEVQELFWTRSDKNMGLKTDRICMSRNLGFNQTF